MVKFGIKDSYVTVTWGNRGHVPSQYSSEEHRRDLAERALDLHFSKAQDYSGADFGIPVEELIMGQWLKLRDKVQKLRRPMWDKFFNSNFRELNHEGTEEILMDIIGHALVALELFESNKAKPVEEEETDE